MQIIILIASLALNGLFFGAIVYLLRTEDARQRRRECRNLMRMYRLNSMSN